MVNWGDPVGSPTASPLILSAQLLDHVASEVSAALGDVVAQTTIRLLTNTATTTITVDTDDAYIITGDIPAMWLRDSCLQLAPLLRLLPHHRDLARVPVGLLRRHWRMIVMDPYANAFNHQANGARWDEDLPPAGLWVWERKWELDSLTYPLDLALQLAAIGIDDWYTEDFLAAMGAILTVAETEQDHDQLSPYRFIRPGAGPRDTLIREGLGPVTRPCGLVFQGFRPSDDACELGYNVPGNAFFGSTLNKLAPLLPPDLGCRAAKLADQIRSALAEHAILTDGKENFLAYEVDGTGSFLFCDDANLPSLLGLPYLGVLAVDDPIYLATRARVLSPKNPYFVTGSAMTGVGSAHTPPGYVWPIAVAVAGLTSRHLVEKVAAIETLLATTGGTGWMHEALDANDPSLFTREWFSWANAMWCELVLEVSGFPSLRLPAVVGAIPVRSPRGTTRSHLSQEDPWPSPLQLSSPPATPPSPPLPADFG